ncbi:hypothetical protein BASA50_005579 [Batrachochytrium salamandrivorans]|uniref:Uncharacterized protein n=1 Tax=Batrachochytrium salamandrivorans TaxID=1357716 RepID=A0ABQ8FCG2_9FUNG|nr:hypothetical protein BASA50_005579 [Batrachochytrium salamandrivorans]
MQVGLVNSCGTLEFPSTRSSATSSATSSVTSSVTFSLEPSPSPSPAPDSRPDAVQRQMDKSPIIKNAFNNDEDHNAMLMDMYNSKEEILQLAGQIERKCLGYIDNTEEGDDTTQTKFVEGFNSDNIDYKDVIKLLSEVDELS